MSFWNNALWLFAVQLSAPPGTEASPAAGGAANNTAAQEPSLFSNLMLFLPMMLAIMLVYMLVMKPPQAKEQQKLKDMLADLKKNDKVVLAGGILASIVNFNSDSEYVTVRIDETNNTKMQVLKQSIVRIVKDKEDSAPEKGN